MHLHWIRTVVKYDALDGNSFAKICLDSIDAHIEEAANM